MNKVRTTAFLCLLVHAVDARADQCWAVTPAQAKKAESVIRPGMTAVHWCEPCGESAPGAAFKITTVARTGKGDDTNIVVNGQAEDLAYLFVQQPDKSFANAARLAGCPTEGVSPSIAARPAASGGKQQPSPDVARRVTISISSEQITDREKMAVKLIRECVGEGIKSLADIRCESLFLALDDLLIFAGNDTSKRSGFDDILIEAERIGAKYDVFDDVAKLKKAMSNFSCRSKQSEAKSNLKALWVGEESFRAENDTYSMDMAKAGFEPKGTRVRYRYSVIRADKNSFVARAVGEGEMTGDAWEVTESGVVKNISDTCK